MVDVMVDAMVGQKRCLPLSWSVRFCLFKFRYRIELDSTPVVATVRSRYTRLALSLDEVELGSNKCWISYRKFRYTRHRLSKA